MRYPERVETPANPKFDADPNSSDTPARFGTDRRLLLFAGIGLAVYLLSLIATIPARLFVPLPDAGGTIWRGEAPLAGGNRLAWRWAPFRSLYRFGFAADISVTGIGNQLAGKALLRPGRIILDDIAGSADGGLLDAVARPSFACSVRMQLDIRRLGIGGDDQGADGRIEGEPGVCQAFGGAGPVAIPALTLDLSQTPGMTMINLAPRGRGRTPFLVGGLSENGELRLIVTEEGAAALPFASPPGGMKIETEL